MKLRVGDNVVILAGKDRGKTGFVGKILKEKNQIWIDGVNKKTRHVKAQQGRPGEKVDFFAPVDASNVGIIDPETKKPSRIGFQVNKGQKTRISKSSGKVLSEAKGKVPAALATDSKKDKKTKTIKA